MKAKLTIQGIKKAYNIEIMKTTYNNNNALALEAYDKEGSFCTLSVNLPMSRSLPKNQCFFKNYSENEGFLEQLETQGLVKRLGPSVQTGFVSVPLVEVLF
jgi:hypothetical protein